MGVLMQPHPSSGFDQDLFKILKERMLERKELVAWFRRPESSFYQPARLRIIK